MLSTFQHKGVGVRGWGEDYEILKITIRAMLIIIPSTLKVNQHDLTVNSDVTSYSYIA